LHGPYWDGPSWGIGTAWYAYNGVEFKVYSLVTRERLIAAVFFALYWGTAILCGLQVFRLLGFYSRGEIFTRKSVSQIRQWGFTCAALGIAKLGYALLPLPVANSRNTQGTDLSMIVNGLIIVAISWFMDMATEMQEENEPHGLTENSMPIVVNVDVMLARRKMRLNTLADLVGITPQNLSVLKTGRARAIRFSTLERLCVALECGPGDLLIHEQDFASDRAIEKPR
jgi:putative transcriptional regulator